MSKVNIEKDSCTILLITHSSYLDICLIFLELFEKYWPDCPYSLIISSFGENIRHEKYRVINNGEHATIIDCITNAAKQLNSNNYLCFLGDAFINDYVNSVQISSLINDLISNHIDYCNLIPKQTNAEEKLISDHIRLISSKDRYNHSFIAFFASAKFIHEEFDSGEINSDFEFESKYLNLINKAEFEPLYYFSNNAIVKTDYFHIVPGIIKGKWNRLSYQKIKMKNPELYLDCRALLPFPVQLVLIARNYVVNHISNDFRRKIKKLFPIVKLFGTDY